MAWGKGGLGSIPLAPQHGGKVGLAPSCRHPSLGKEFRIISLVSVANNLDGFEITGLKLYIQVKKQCDQKLLIRMKTKCVPCSLNLDTQCPAGYTKITNGTGTPDCRYYLEIKTHTLSFPGCRHRCVREFEQPECCQGHWGPDCMVCDCVHGVCNSGITGDGRCSCLSGYKGLRCDQPINPCSRKVCDPNADCVYLGPNQHKCTCGEGYTGDGQVCLPIDPCQAAHGSCPAQSSICIYDGPGKSHCECKEHYTNFVPGKGCSMMDHCETNNTCHKKAKCLTVAPGQIACTCQGGSVGNGFVCYGNIMERLQELNAEVGGQWQGKLTSSLVLMENTYEWQLSTLGPFTVLVPTNKGLKGINIKDLLKNKQKAQYFVKLHIIAGQLNTSSLNNANATYTLTGKAGKISKGEKDNQLRIQIQGGRGKGKILQGDIIASNGILHIIDKAMDNVEPTFESSKEKTGLAMDLQQDKQPYTIFVPSNKALSNMKAEVLDYLLSEEGSWKLLELVRYHIVSNTELEVASLVSIEHIRTMAKQFIHFNRTSTGQVLVSGEKIEETDIVAKNGRIYTLEGILIPPTIVPILPQWCDETSQVTKKPKCCKGFFGPDCRPCPGGFSKPCSGKGQCMDGLDGNGTCVCSEAFQGSSCQFCSDPGKYGPQCDKECLCIYGKCDNRIDSDGTCLPGSCRTGYTGKLCEKQIAPCEPSLQLCHAYADCQLSDGTVSCVCKPGYEGDGLSCSKVDPCAVLNPGGCNINAECVQTGPGEHRCVCQAGWTGDGRDCSAINNCLLPSTARCHQNATCIDIGPGQATCQFESSRGWECVCPVGYEGDGRICYGNAADEAKINSVLSTTPNLTVLVPSLQAIENMDEDEKAFWMSESNIPTLLKYHVLTGAYSFADFQNLSSSDMLPTSLESKFLHLSKENGTPILEGAHFVASDIASTNGVIHVIDKVLTPLRSAAMPRLLDRLEQMPDYSIFRGYIIQYSLANEIEAANAYTVFAPSNNAIENYLKDKKTATLDEGQIRYHVVLDEKLLKNNLHNGMHRETLLGFSYQVGFFLRNSQVYINDAPISYANVATDKGIIHGLGKVLEIQKNRCDINNTVIIAGEKKYCVLTEYHMRHYTIQIGCQPKCAKTIIFEAISPFPITKSPCENADLLSTLHATLPLSAAFLGLQTRECCAGFFGQQCQPCPGKAGSACYGNGVCQDGINGTGSCQCEEGFVGTACESCSEGRYGPNCDQAIDACERSNGGCSTKAECRRTTPGNRACVCSAGYTGDGIVCIEINPCLVNNGGCDRNAECTQTGPDQNNGGCSEFAICNDTELTERTCTCKTNYTGDGFQCRGNILQALSVRDISGPGPFTLFVPHTDVLNSDPRVEDWIAKGAMAQVLRYHMVGCASLLYKDLTAITNITSLQGEQIHISYSQNSLVLNNRAEIILSDAVGTNGVIHVINQILVPSHMQDFPFKKESLKMVAARHGYILFSTLLEKNNLLGLINDPIHKPVTLFWPTDTAIRGLPQEQQDFLFKKANTKKLVQYLKFHIVRDAAVLAHELPSSSPLKTLQGSNLSVSCGDNGEIGALFLNDGQCKVVQRQLEFDGGIAYGIDCLLTEPSLGGRCDSFLTMEFMEGIHWCTYESYGLRRDGCRRNCSMVMHIAKCCKGYFGPDCQACPGGPETPCHGHGSCDDGYTGTGECRCHGGFNGTACELCLPGRYGFSCRPVPPACSPSCSVNAVCTENNTCQCKPLYNGDGITCTAAELCKQNNGGCHKAAECTQHGVKVFCSCQKGYKGDGFTCLPINPCADGFNGGCHEHAICTVVGPGRRKCECKNNYIGDGLNCSVMQLPLDRCLQDNGQCHPDADCADLHFQDSTVGVFHLRSPLGQYRLTYQQAREACANESATVATYSQLLYAQKARYHLCSAGWLDGERVGYPTGFSSPNCGSGYVGIVDYGRRVNLSETWDVFCYREKEVNCTCKPGYVGDGSSCSGNLLQVLMSFPTLTNFLSDIMTYSNTSRKGREFLQYLTDLSVHATLFAPNDSGLRENETLSGRDIEYHLSNANIMFYEDLTNGTTLLTRLGKKLLITNTGGQEHQIPTADQREIRYVDRSAIVEWDIIASNGIIHIISEPLKAPSEPAPLHASTGTGIFFGICLVTGIVALIGYSYLRFRKKNIVYQHFKSDTTSLDKSQPSNITNPSYESSSTLTSPEPTYDLFSDSDDQQLVMSDPHDQN
ncbi:stabilin 2 [Turdus rufiventris]|nr:stabilin 2 [Turdus rufiventris]